MRISDWSSDVCSSDLFDFVNPNAPKGGTLILSANGTFDTFNPFNAKGTAAASAGIATETLMVNGDDEAFTMYGLLAETIEWPEDRSWIIRSEEHTSELQSLMRISYAVFCLKKKKEIIRQNKEIDTKLHKTQNKNKQFEQVNTK